MTFLSPKLSIVMLLLAASSQVQSQETWCGKNYKPGQPVVEPGGAYPIPQESPENEPLLLFRCTPKFRPYIHGDGTTATILVDLAITNTKMNGTTPLTSTDMTMGERNQELYDPVFLVTLSTENITLLAARPMRLGMKQKIVFPLLPILPRHRPHKVTCTATWRLIPRSPQASIHVSPAEHNFTAHTSLAYHLPNPNGSMVKIDSEIRGLFHSLSDQWRATLPYGFYTAFDNYLAKNLTILDEAVYKSYTIVHPVPTFGNLTALEMVLDRMEELGLFLMYDLRWSYKNITQLTEEVNRVKHRKNLLLWYTADEPDGRGDNPNDAKQAYDSINELDGYHPISLALNCQDYYFRSYTTGTADILLQDTYPIGINASHSTVYDTPCTSNFGDCGCDNCAGNGIVEIADRLDWFHKMLDWEGRTDFPVWSVVQAFGNQSFWTRIPSDREFIAQALTSYIHGATGLVPWIAPTTEEIGSVSEKLGRTNIAIRMFLLHSKVAFSVPDSARAAPPEQPLASGFQRSGQLLLSHATHRDAGPALDIPSLNKRTLQRGLWVRRDIGAVMFLASNLGNEPVSFNLRFDNGRRPTMYALLVLGAVVTTIAGDGPIGQYQITFEGLGSVALFFI